MTFAHLTSIYQVRPVPGPSGGIPFIGGYSEIYPDFLGNYKRLLQKYGHIVHVGYLGKVRISLAPQLCLALSSS